MHVEAEAVEQAAAGIRRTPRRRSASPSSPTRKRRMWRGPSATCVAPVSTMYSSDSSGEKARPLGCTKSSATTRHRAASPGRCDRRSSAPISLRRSVALVVGVDAVARVGEPDAAVGLHHHVVGRVEALAVEVRRRARCACRRARCARRSARGARRRRAGPARSTVWPLVFIDGWRNTETEPSVSSQRIMRSFGMSDHTR